MEHKHFVLDRFAPRDVLKRVVSYSAWGLLILAIYALVMLPVFTFARQLFMTEREPGSLAYFFSYDFWYLLYAILYIIPLYYFHFRKNAQYQNYIRNITEDNTFSCNTILQFIKDIGKFDLIIYYAYSLLLLLPFNIIDNNPFIWIHVQSIIFYRIPAPRVICYVLAVLFFTGQYILCLYLVGKKWDKNRLPSDHK